MHANIHTYPLTILEHHLDTFGHVNNAVYLEICEEARWDLLTKNGYGLHKIMSSRIGPTILEIKIQFLKELKLRDEILIESRLVSYQKKIGILEHRIMRGTDLCCTAEIVLALFDLNQRKIIAPTPEWLKGIGAISD